ncbi:glycosyltransferase [Nonomuraea sp. NPDC050153]|uniref:glycosyltransferase n=1 Tax=Nonomuraea sp. NPDC050153 TaxID=3364359 RepID=UPI00379E4F89
MRIVRLANFVTPTSGGLRTALHELGAGYAAAGHEPVLVVPGATARDERTPAGRVITLPGPVVPGLGGYRGITARGTLRRLLDELAPDVRGPRRPLSGRRGRRAGVPADGQPDWISAARRRRLPQCAI